MILLTTAKQNSTIATVFSTKEQCAGLLPFDYFPQPLETLNQARLHWASAHYESHYVPLKQISG